MAFLDELVGWLETLPRQETLPRAEQAGADGVEHAGPSEYAEEVGLASRARGAWARLPMGDVLLKLKGRARIKWLLYVEMAQSAGMRDPWRLSREGLVEAVRLKGFEAHHWDVKRWPMPAEHDVMWRWMSIGIWRYENDREGLYFELGRRNSLVEEVLSDPPEPLASLAWTMSRDQEGEDLGDVIPSQMVAAPARSALGEFARNTKHELANRLIPFQTVVATLIAELRHAGVSPDRVDALETRATEKVDYLFRFGKGLGEMAETARSPHTVFTLGVVVQEAIQTTQAERNGRVEVVVMDALEAYDLLGPRQQVTDALVNLLRNAAQSRAVDPVRIEVRAYTYGPNLSLVVDDDGPGVPDELRQRIFEDGFSTRGGSGLGLAIVERVAISMGGTAQCEKSPLGGARFTLVLPLQERGAHIRRDS